MLDMSITTLLTSLCFLASGLCIIHFLVMIFLAGFRDSFGGSFERLALRRQSLRCQRGDKLLEQNDLDGAVQAFGSAFFLKPILYEPSLLTEVGKYHTGLLNRLLTVADALDTARLSLPALADTDRLLAERQEIQLSAFEERSRKGRSLAVPDPKDPRLRENEQQLRVAIDRLLRAITSSGEERVVYH